MNLTVTEFNEAYYDEHKAAGLDYLGHGWWQQSYARMVLDSVAHAVSAPARVVDLGCACGSILMGFKEVGCQVWGCDVNGHMVDIGREHFKLDSREIWQASARDTGLNDGFLDVVHSAQVFEHMPEEVLPAVLTEIARIMKPEGRAFICLDAIKYGQCAEDYAGDPTHITIRPIAFWECLFMAHGFKFDTEGYERFTKSMHTVREGGGNSFFKEYPNWTVFVLKR